MLPTHSSHVCATRDQLPGTAARSAVLVELLYETELTTNGRRYVFQPQSPVLATRTKVRFPLLAQFHSCCAYKNGPSSLKVRAIEVLVHVMELSMLLNFSSEIIFSWSPGIETVKFAIAVLEF